MISKDLLSEVLEININKIKEVHKVNNIIKIVDTKNMYNDINIYELANKCKEWAYEIDFYIYSIFTFAGEGACYVTKDDEILKRLATFAGDSEPEAIFKACQWILDYQK